MTVLMIIVIIGLVFFVIGCTTEAVWMRVTGLIICALFVCCILGYCCGVTVPSSMCKWKAEAMGVECKFDFFAGCLVKYNGIWYPIDSRRVIE